MRAERNRRALSVRQAAVLGGVSNTAWGDMEHGVVDLTPRLRMAVAAAFDWPEDWPETMTQAPDSTLVERIETLEQQVRDLLGRTG